MAEVFSIKNILDKKMNRKQFLQYIGLVLLGLTGINGILSNIMKPERIKDFGAVPNKGSKFGASKYGK